MCRVGNCRLVQSLYEEFVSLVMSAQEEAPHDGTDWIRFRDLFQKHTVGTFEGDTFQQSHQSLVISALSGFFDLDGKKYFKEYAPPKSRKRKYCTQEKDESDDDGGDGGDQET